MEADVAMGGDEYIYGFDGDSGHGCILIPKLNEYVYIKSVQLFTCQSHLNKMVFFFKTALQGGECQKEQT